MEINKQKALEFMSQHIFRFEKLVEKFGEVDGYAYKSDEKNLVGAYRHFFNATEELLSYLFPGRYLEAFKKADADTSKDLSKINSRLEVLQGEKIMEPSGHAYVTIAKLVWFVGAKIIEDEEKLYTLKRDKYIACMKNHIELLVKCRDIIESLWNSTASVTYNTVNNNAPNYGNQQAGNNY